MREHRILRWCDGCAGDDGETLVEAVETFSVAIAEGEQTHPVPKVLDLCAEHAKALISPLADLLALTGQLPEPTPKASQRATGHDGPPSSQPGTCEICGKRYVSQPGISGHIWAVHLKRRPPAFTPTCSICGETFESGQGTRMHMTVTHGRSGLDDAYAAARAAGLMR